MTKKKDRTEEEVAASFIQEDVDQVDPNETIDDDPDPDFAREAGLTTVGTVSDGDDEPGSRNAGAEGPVGRHTATETPAPTMENIMLMLVDALRNVAAGSANSQQMAQQALEQAARQQQPDNKFAPAISDFNPQGDRQYPRPKLKCPMFLPWEAEAESLTYEEIELLNLLEDGEYTIKRNDGSKVGVKVKLKRNLNGTPDVLLMNSEQAYNEENHWMMPGLTMVLRQVLGHRPHTKRAAAEIMTMDERMEAVRAGELPVSVGAR